jgi:hypothetical protein
MARKRLPPREYIQTRLDYDPETGAFQWRPREESLKTWNTRFARRPAGSVQKGYLMIVIDYHRYFAHRIAWLIIHGRPVPDEIDHIDHDPLNNRINNLRAARHGDNGANAKRRSDNQTGVKGVGLWYGKYRARIRRDGKEYVIGCFATLEEAAAARRQAADRLHGTFVRHD